MEKASLDKSSQSADFNSLSKYSKSAEVSLQANLDKSLLNRTFKRASTKALLADLMQDKPEELNSPISKDSKP